jgi:hypothetical protein
MADSFLSARVDGVFSYTATDGGSIIRVPAGSQDPPPSIK